MKQELTEDERKAVDALSNCVRIDLKISHTIVPSLGYERIARAVAGYLGIEAKDTKNLIQSAIEKNPKEFKNYFIKHSS